MSIDIKTSKLTIVLIGLVSIALLYGKNARWKPEGKIIAWDVAGYYIYLPATFIYNDIGLNYLITGKDYKEMFAPHVSDTGKRFTKYSMGVALLHLPFFGTAHAWAKISGHAADGYSLPYRYMFQISSLFYTLLGLLYLAKLSRVWIKKEWIIGLTVILIYFGTNLMYYTLYEPGMPHAYNFMLLAVFLWATVKWHNGPTFKLSALLGILIGLITLTRPTNITISLFFICYNTWSLKCISDRISYFWKHRNKLLVLIMAAFLAWVPQMLYWHHIFGEWLHYSYSDEQFFFTNPQIINGLFSYRKGWFLYSPIMLIAILGLIGFTYKNKQLALGVWLFFALNIYITFSWWCWWYGGSFGSRPMIDSYAVYGLGLASIIQLIATAKQWIVKTVLLLAIIAIGGLGTVLTYQSVGGTIHFDSMTKETYWKSMGKFETYPGYWKSLSKPDYDKARYRK